MSSCFSLLAACTSVQDNSELQSYSELSPTAIQQLEPATPQAYKIGVGDELDIRVLKRSDLRPVFDLANVTVSEEGTIYVPLAGDIRVEGLTETELRKEVELVLSSDLNQPVVSVRVTNARNKRAFLLGEVKNPGIYALSTNTTVLELIAMAGGQSKDANMSKIALFRSQLPAPDNSQPELGVTLDIQTLLENAEFRQNVILRPGDIIYVPNDSIARSNRYFNHLQSIVEPFVSVISGVGNIIFINREFSSSE